MSIYTAFISPSQLISPINGYTCRRITKQNIKQFGFESIEELHEEFPDFPLMCDEYQQTRDSGESLKSIETRKKINCENILKNKIEKNLYNINPSLCPKCNNSISYEKRNNKFCSRKCANSRGARTTDFKEKISNKLKGKPGHSKETIRKIILSQGLLPREDKPNTICVVCDQDTKTKQRKTCSKKCLEKLQRLLSQKNPNCGGQKHTHRSKIKNKRGEIFSAESSYEVKVSEILIFLNVEWIRPSYMWYIDHNGNKRRYYPDFYLPEYDLYLDPKNDYLIRTDIDKIYKASEYNNIKIVILGKKFLNKAKIQKLLVGDRGNAPLLPVCKTGTLLLS